MTGREEYSPLVDNNLYTNVEITLAGATYELRSGAPLEIDHWGAPLAVPREGPVVRAIPPPTPIPALRQPCGRAPSRRRPPTPRPNTWAG